jgi:hypothetical protein
MNAAMRASFVLLVVVAMPLSAQRGSIEHRYSVFIDGATASDTYGSFFNNFGGGASLDFRPFTLVSSRLTASYNRVATGGPHAPLQFRNVSADLVFYPTPESRIRPYLLAGLGYSHQTAHAMTIVRNGVTTTASTRANYFLGTEYGAGLELGGLFIQYRVPPRPRITNTGMTGYSLISLGLRF